jgi:hypothetical protein
VTWHLRGGVVEPEEMAVAGQWLSKYKSVTVDMHTTIEELLKVVFSRWFILRLYSEGDWGKCWMVMAVLLS